MFNTFKVHPQDTVRREGSFQQFPVEEPRQHQAVSSPTKTNTPHHQQQHPYQQPAITLSDQYARRRALSEPLPIMEPSLNKMHSCDPGGPPMHYPRHQARHLNPMHAALPPLQTQFSPKIQYQTLAEPQLTPRSEYGVSPYSPYTPYSLSPISPHACYR